MPHRIRRTSLTVGLAVAALALSACGGSTPGTDTSSSGASDTLKLAFIGSISTPDPDSAYDGSELSLVNNAYEGLLDYQPGEEDPTLVGRLATDWSANDDNTEFTFTLREGVTFHDGTPFTADAVKASFDRRSDVDAGPAYMVAGVKSVTTDGDYQVTITLDSPNSSFLDLLASPFGPKMISPTALEEHPWTGEDDNWFATNDAGTGPYEYADFAPDSSYDLTAYPDYWGDAPGYDTVHFDVISSLSTAQLQLEAGDLNGLIGYTDSASFSALEDEDGLSTYAFPSMQTPTLFVNPKSAALGDDATRKAFVSGIDFPTLAADALGDTGSATTEVFPENLLPSDQNQQVIDYDDTALATLADGGLKGKTITCGYPASSASGGAMCDNITAMLNTAGITAKSTSYPSGTYYTAVGKGADGPDITFFSGFPDTAHPDAWATVFYTPNGGLDLFGASVPGVEDLLAKALKTGDDDLYAQVAQKVSASAYWYSAATSLGTAVFTDDVAGVEASWNPVTTQWLELQYLSPSGS